VGAEPLVQLAVSDVDGDDQGRSPLQETVGEPSGRRAGVESGEPGNADPEAFDGEVELLAAPTYEAWRRPAQSQRVTGGNQTGRLVRWCTADTDPTGADQRDRLLPARRESPADELGVEAAA